MGTCGLTFYSFLFVAYACLTMLGLHMPGSGLAAPGLQVKHSEQHTELPVSTQISTRSYLLGRWSNVNFSRSKAQHGLIIILP